MRPVRARLADGSEAVYWYCRLTNTRLPDPADPAFAAALKAARSTAAARYAEGTLGWLLERWRASPEYTALAERTRAARDRYLRAVEVPQWSARQAASLKRAELLDLRDAIAQARGPAAANMFALSLATVLSWAVDRGRLEYNPMTRIKALPGGHFLAWTEAEAQIAMTQFREPVRRAVVLAYHIGQRRGDLVALRWDQYDGKAIWLQPEQTKKRREAKGLGPLRLPCAPALRAELDRWKAENSRRDTPALTILTTPRGRPWQGEYLSDLVAAEVRRLKLREGLNLHGFRKLLAIRVAENGGTAHEIMSIGWDDLRTAQLYTLGVSQQKLAETAIGRLQKGERPRPRRR